jgi:glycosyltransferase 2 family protein
MKPRHLLLAAQAAVTLLLLALLFQRFDWPAFVGVVRRISPAFYVLSLFAIAVAHGLNGLRWRVVLSGMGVRVGYGDMARQVLIGLFFSNLAPTAIGGDAAKVYYLGRTAGYVAVGASVIADRMLGFVCLAIIGAAIGWTIGAPSPLFALNRTLLTAFAIGLTAIIGLAAASRIDRWLLWLRSERLRQWLARGHELMRLGACRRPAIAAAAVVALVNMVMLTVVYQLFFAAVGVVAPPFLAVMAVVVSMAVFVNVPISVNGIGLREQLHFLLFAALGVPKEASVGIALLLFSHTLLISLAGYVVWLRAHPAAASYSPASPV